MKKGLYSAALLCSMAMMLLSITSFAEDKSEAEGIVVAKTGIELMGSNSQASFGSNNTTSRSNGGSAYTYYNGGITTDGSTQSYVYYNGRYVADDSSRAINYYNGGLTTN